MQGKTGKEHRKQTSSWSSELSLHEHLCDHVCTLHAANNAHSVLENHYVVYFAMGTRQPSTKTYMNYFPPLLLFGTENICNVIFIL